jgi:hypothetical protein
LQHQLNPLNAELNPICHLLALLGAHRILHVSRIRVKVEPKILQHGSVASNNRLKQLCIQHDGVE